MHTYYHRGRAEADRITTDKTALQTKHVVICWKITFGCTKHGFTEAGDAATIQYEMEIVNCI